MWPSSGCCIKIGIENDVAIYVTVMINVDTNIDVNVGIDVQIGISTSIDGNLRPLTLDLACYPPAPLLVPPGLPPQLLPDFPLIPP